ncbi:ABC transporter permease [Phocaeicola sp.]
MIKLYLKQAWTLIKQNKLYTTIYIVGTGLSIALTMTMFIIFYVKFAPIYPEYNRDRTLVIKSMKCYPKDKPDNWNCNNGASYYVVKELLQKLPHLDKIAGGAPDLMGGNTVTLTDKKEMFAVAPYYADNGFWDVFTFRFLSGKPYTRADVEASLPVAVLSESLARRIFASTDVAGQYFIYNGKEFRVCGVVEDVSNATPDTSGDLWLPLFHNMWVQPNADGDKLIGNVRIYMTASTAADKKALRAEVQEVFRKHNLQSDRFINDLLEQPDDFWKSTFRISGCNPPNMKEILKTFLYMLLALLFIPAMNLSGMISSRMDQRLCEMGVRKAYGATNHLLIGQILWENLLFTCIGGLVGLFISYLIVITTSDWVLMLFDDKIIDPSKTSFLTFEMLFNPVVFGFALGLCILLNLISAFVPATWALRRTIIQSLNTNR